MLFPYMYLNDLSLKSSSNLLYIILKYICISYKQNKTSNNNMTFYICFRPHSPIVKVNICI